MKVRNQSMTEFARDCTYTFGSYTIENRALPDFRDGLKPVYRRILWCMYKNSFTSNSNFRKSARTTGDTAGKYHPHGTTSIYSAMATLVNSNEPLIQGQGEWGSYAGTNAAADRYTESRLSKFSEQYLLDPVYLRCVPIVSNYDGEFEEPVYLPAKLPVLLINGSEGIATGCSNLVPSFSTESVKNLIKLALRKRVDWKICRDTLEFSFFYGGEECCEEELLEDYFKTGNSSLNFIPRYTYNNKKLTISSTAPRFNITKFMDNACEVKGVKSVDDFSEGETINIVIELTKDDEDLADEVMELAITRLSCQTLITTRHDDGEHADFKRTTIPDIVNMWVDWRIALEAKVVIELLRVEAEKLETQELLKLAVLNRELIILSLNDKDPAKFLVSKLKISEDKANRILDLKVRRLASLELSGITDKIKEIKTIISELKLDSKDTLSIKKRIIKQLS